MIVIVKIDLYTGYGKKGLCQAAKKRQKSGKFFFRLGFDVG